MTAVPPRGAEVLLLADDGLGIAERVAHALSSRGWRPEVLGAPEVDLADGCAVTEAVQRVRAAAGPIGGVIHLASVAGGPDPGGVDLAGWRVGLRRQVNSLFHLARAVDGDVLQRRDRWLLAVTALGARPATATDVGGGGVAGLTRSLAEEAACAVRLLHLPVGQRHVEADAATVLREVDRIVAGGGPAELEIGYADGRRFRPRVTAAPVAPATRGRASVVGPESVVLLTGGARGITAHVAHELAQFGATLVLVGRSAGPNEPEPADTAAATDERALRATLVDAARRAGTPVDLPAVAARARALLADREARANLHSLREASATVDYWSADLRDEGQVVRLLHDVLREHGRLDGVVHGAGVLDDRLLRDKTAASFDHVFHTKADSAYLLARHLDPDTLRFLVFFGSVAGRFGNAGQTDYAAANEVLTCLARDLDARWPGRVVTMCWGPWAGGGMVTPEVERRFLERGLEPITPQVGRRLFREELELGPTGDAVVVLGRGPWALSATTPPVPALPISLVDGGSGEAPAVLETVLDPATDGYLDDHRLDGAPVLAAAVAAELLAEAAELALPGHCVIELHDLSVLQGVVLEDGPARLRITVSPPGRIEDGATRCRTTLSRTGQESWSYRATAVLSPGQPAGLSASSLSPAGADVPRPPDQGSMYADLLFHGPLFQGLDSVAADATGWMAIGHGVPPGRFTSRSPGGSWVLDPSLLDLGPQLAIAWSRSAHGTTTLPVRFGTVRRGRATGGADELRLRFRVRAGADPAWQVADFEVLNADGSVRLAVEGLEAAGTASLNRLATSGVGR
jgi:NAD(P)-dependent dehydrogenase (short-subunit alcohol dehydrogenase family)